MVARFRLTILTVGNTMTFRRPCYGQTIPYGILVSEDIVRDIVDWTVMEDYTGSGHQYISYNVKNCHLTKLNPAPSGLR